MDDWLIILLIVLWVGAMNAAYFMIKDMARLRQEDEEIEHWLEHGEKNDNNHS